MRKRLAILFTLLFTTIGSSAVAASADKFSDIPADDWSYKAVNELKKVGIIDGYQDKNFQGNKTMTRYEMAKVVEKAMENSNKATAKQKALIDKLAAEFALEINNIDTPLTKVEKFTQSTLRVGFDTLMTYGVDNPPAGQTKVKGNEAFMSRFRMYLFGDLNDKTKFIARIGTSYGLAGMSRTTTAVGNANTYMYVDMAHFTFSDTLGFNNIKLGRQSITELGGNLARKDGSDGITFEKKMSPNTTLRTGVLVAKVDTTTPSDAQDFGFISLNSQVNERFGISGMYFNNNISVAPATGVVSYNGSTISGVSAYQKLGKWILLGEYDKASFSGASSNVERNPHAYAIQLSTSKIKSFFVVPQTMCDINKPGDDAFTIAYRYEGAGVVPSGFSSWRNATANSATYNPNFLDNVKGWSIDYQYTLMKGLAVDFTYMQLKYANSVGGTAIAGNKVDNCLGIALQSRF